MHTLQHPGARAPEQRPGLCQADTPGLAAGRGVAGPCPSPTARHTANARRTAVVPDPPMEAGGNTDSLVLPAEKEAGSRNRDEESVESVKVSVQHSQPQDGQMLMYPSTQVVLWLKRQRRARLCPSSFIHALSRSFPACAVPSNCPWDSAFSPGNGRGTGSGPA
jgi:hypothetical protein